MFDDRPWPDRQLAETGALMAAARSLDDVVRVLERNTRAIAGSDGIAVVLREGESCRYVAEDAVEPLWKGCRFPLEICVSGWAMVNEQTVVIPDIALDPRVPMPLYEIKAIRSLMMVPIGLPRPVAALGAYWCAQVLLDDATRLRLEALARQAGEALTRLGIGTVEELAEV